jgi:hypothetical protein
MSSPRCTLYLCTPILQIGAASPKYNFGVRGYWTLQSQPYGAGLVVNHHLWQATQVFKVLPLLQFHLPQAYPVKLVVSLIGVSLFSGS